MTHEQFVTEIMCCAAPGGGDGYKLLSEAIERAKLIVMPDDVKAEYDSAVAKDEAMAICTAEWFILDNKAYYESEYKLLIEWSNKLFNGELS